MIASLALIVALVSVIIALLAYRNARRGVRHQEAIDARSREFRDVVWKGEWAMGTMVPELRLTNVGTTVANEVVLSIGVPGEAKNKRFPVVRPGETVAFDPDSPIHRLRATNDKELLASWGRKSPTVADASARPWRVHWTSDLGHAQWHTDHGRQLF